MNSKELIAAVASNLNTETLYQALIEDAKALVKARRAQSPEAQRSCYMEQDQKWKSSCKKTGLGPDDFLNWTRTQPGLQGRFDAPKPKAERNTEYLSSGMLGKSLPSLSMLHMIGAIYAREAEERKLKAEKALADSVHLYLKSVDDFYTHMRVHDGFTGESDQSVMQDASKLALVRFIGLTIEAVVDIDVGLEFVNFMVRMCAGAKDLRPELTAYAAPAIERIIAVNHADKLAFCASHPLPVFED